MPHGYQPQHSLPYELRTPPGADPLEHARSVIQELIGDRDYWQQRYEGVRGVADRWKRVAERREELMLVWRESCPCLLCRVRRWLGRRHSVRNRGAA